MIKILNDKVLLYSTGNYIHYPVICYIGKEYEKECSLQFSSVAQSCLALCDPMDCSTPGFPVHHQLSELAQTHVHQVSLGNTRPPKTTSKRPLLLDII